MTPEPIFLSLSQVMEIHSDLIATFGGMSGLRDSALLLSALAMPMATYEGAYLHSDSPEMATAIFFIS